MSTISEKQTAWKAELNRLGISAVQKKLDQAGVSHAAVVRGFVSGDIERGFIEEWLAETDRAVTKQRAQTLVWAQIAGLASVLALVLTLVSLWLQITES